MNWRKCSHGVPQLQEAFNKMFTLHKVTLCCLFVFTLHILITLWYLQTLFFIIINKNVDIQFIVDGAFLEKSSSGTFKVKRLESQMIERNMIKENFLSLHFQNTQDEVIHSENSSNGI